MANARYVEQVVDEPHHAADLSIDEGLRPALGGSLLLLALQKADAIFDRSKRVAQLMPEHRQKLVLAPVGIDEFLDPQLCLAQGATVWRDVVHSAAIHSAVPGNAGQNGRPGSPGHSFSHSPSRPRVAVVG